MMLQWLNPQAFWLSALLCLFALLGYWHSGFSLAPPRWQQQVFRHPLAHLLPQQPRSVWRRYTERGVLLWFMCCVSVAMMQPVRLGERLPALPPERDIVLLVDVSISMTLQDYVVDGVASSRMQMLQNLLQAFTQQLQGERLGVIIFAEQPYVLVPLTRDQHLVQQQLQRIQPALAGRVSAVGDALILGLQQAAQHAQRQQLFVLLTDADESVGKVDPVAAGQLLAEAQIPLYTLALGSSSAHAAPTKQQGLLYQPVNLDLLQAITEPTGGKLWQATDSDVLGQALAEIQQQHQNRAQASPRYQYQPLYPWLLLAGLLPLLAWQFSHAWRRGGA